MRFPNSLVEWVQHSELNPLKNTGPGGLGSPFNLIICLQMYCLLNYYGLGLQMNLRWGCRVAQDTKSGLFTCLSHRSPVYISGLLQGKKAQSSTKGRIKQSNHQIKTAIMADRIMKEQNEDISLEELWEAGSFRLIILTLLNSASSSSGVFLIEKSQGDLKNSNLGTSESFSIA